LGDESFSMGEFTTQMAGDKNTDNRDCKKGQVSFLLTENERDQGKECCAYSCPLMG